MYLHRKNSKTELLFILHLKEESYFLIIHHSFFLELFDISWDQPQILQRERNYVLHEIHNERQKNSKLKKKSQTIDRSNLT